MLVSKVQKWGDSQGLLLSKQVLDLANMEVGDEVEIVVHRQEIVVKKSASSKYNLADLVAQIPADYKPEEVDFGGPVGKEVW